MKTVKPTRMYATKHNLKSNDFNWESEFIEVHYDVLGCKNGMRLVNRAGWDGEKHRHYVKESSLHFEREITK